MPSFESLPPFTPGAPRPFVARPLAALGIAVAASFVVAACGGGSDAGAAAPPPPAPPPPVSAGGTYADGPISGFGSVIVNGVRFDDSASSVTDDEGRRLSSDDLRLGVEVEIEGGDDQGGRVTAERLHVHSAIVGPVEAVDASRRMLTVLGQAVSVSAATVIDDSPPGGIAGLAGGTVVRVYGPVDATGRTHATRLESGGSPASFRVVGVLGALDAASHRAQVGSAVIDTGGLAALPAGLVVGDRVLAVLDPSPVAGTWRATALVRAERHFQDDHGEAHVHGTVTSFTSATVFEVDGMPVDASHAEFPDGQAGLAPGAEVEVEGRQVDGTLAATSVHLEDERHGLGEDVELHGQISDLDAAALTFTLRGSVVSYASPSLVFEPGDASRLVDGASVEVKGDLAADGRTVVATTIVFEDG